MKNIREEQDLTRPRKKRRMAVDWRELPRDVLVKIAEDHLDSFDDFTMFSSVCRAWNHAVGACSLVKMRGKWSRCQVPWLVLPDNCSKFLSNNSLEVEHFAPGKSDKFGDGSDNSNVEDECCVEKANSGPDKVYRKNLWDIRKSKYYTVCCPRGYAERCWGSPYGWIVTVTLDQKIYLFNPLTNSKHSLPCPRTLPFIDDEVDINSKSFINKVVVLKVPNGPFTRGGSCDNDCTKTTLLVIMFYGYVYNCEGCGHVAVANAGDLRWTGLEWSSSATDKKPDLEDVVYHKDLGLLFVCKRGGVVNCNLWDKKESPALKWYLPRDNLWARA